MTLARLALAWERLWPPLWPAVAALGLFLSLALFDVLPALPGWLHAVVLALLAGGCLYALARAIRGFAWPEAAAAQRRLETESGLAHRPLQAVEDTLAAGAASPASAALWQAHQQRMAEAIRALRVGAPRPGLARRDPIALRAVLALVLLIAVITGWQDRDGRLARALTPGFGAAGGAPKLAFDLWITPPDYTTLAPIFPLRATQITATDADDKPTPPNSATRLLRIPAGSVLTSQVQGAKGPVRLVLAQPGAAKPTDKAATTIAEAAPPPEIVEFERLDQTYSRLIHKVGRGGILSVQHGDTTLGKWRIEIIPDRKPTITFADDPSPTPQASLRLSYTGDDDYGIVKARAELRRTYEHGAVTGKEVVVLELPLPTRNAKKAKETTFLDLAPHKWAGLPIIMKLVAVDAIDQAGVSAVKRLILPERRFMHPVARAIIEQRKRLAGTPEARRDIYRGLSELAADPGAFGHDGVVFLALSSARARLGYDRQKTAIDPILDLLWDTALRIEDGGLSVAERDLRRIQQELMKALAEGAPDAVLERLMRELRMAMNRFMRELAEQMRRNPQQQQTMEFDPSTMRMIRAQDLSRMLDQIRDLMRSGARQAAREMLARLQQMLQGMRSMQTMRMRGGRAGRGQGMLRKLQDLIQRQQGLMDRTFRNSRPGQGPPRSGMPGAADQRALQQLLRQLRGMMRGQGRGTGPGQFMDRADRAMERAIRALEGNRLGEATGQQGRALEALRRAGRAALQRMMERFARESGMRGNRPQNRQPRRDPLGRDISGEDADTSDVKIPNAGSIQRAREILEELRRRSGQINRPRLELDYIERLLDRF
ncbi:MAG: TIGR02302 family protein [Alphaproteobacteria bacterium]